MIKKITFCIGLLSVLLPGIVLGQEVRTDTIRSSRQPLILGDSTDIATVSQRINGNWFISISGGVNSLAAEGNRLYDKFYQRVRPTAHMSIGRWFSPVWGVRFQLGVGALGAHYYPFSFYNLYDQLPDHSTMPEEAKKYLVQKDGKTWFHRKFIYTDMQLNLMTDVVRWFADEEKRVGFYLFTGPSFSHVFKSQGLSVNNSFGWKAGGQLDIKLSDKLSLITELQGTVVDEAFDGQIGGYSDKKNRTLEGYASWTVGLTYKFGGKKFKRYVQVNPVVLETVYHTRPAAVVPVVPEAVKPDMNIPFTVRFYIDKSNIEEDQKLNIHKVATYLQEHPEAKLRLSGYADRETAYPSYNMKLSRRRVDTVKKYIIKTYGIAPERLVIAAKGDVERAYDEDYRWNRAVVMQIVETENE